MREIVALAGGIGASKLLVGLIRAIDPRELTIIVNTGDDIVLHGLAISPDLGYRDLFVGRRGESRDGMGLSR